MKSRYFYGLQSSHVITLNFQSRIAGSRHDITAALMAPLSMNASMNGKQMQRNFEKGSLRMYVNVLNHKKPLGK